MGQGGIRICLVGGTGLVGSALIAEAVGRDDVRVIGVGRREAVLPAGARMEMLVGEPIDWPPLIRAARAQVLVCALGTTIRAAGSQEQFRAIDHDLIRFAAEAARDAGIAHMILVSSIGADRGSNNFYLSVKGQTEEALGRLGFERFDMLRPGLLLGTRSEPRLLERAGHWLAPVLDLFLRGRFTGYRSIGARHLARAILALSREKATGAFVQEHDALVRWAKRA